MANTLGTSSASLTLPSGGGQVFGISESFTPDLHTGSGNFAVPIVCPEAQNGLRPELSLGYSTGGGNGPFGMGFRIPIMTIARETSNGVPEYGAGEGNYLFSESGRLVDCGNGRFRPEVETAHWLIKKTGTHWTVTVKDGTVYTLGPDANARVEQDGKVFSWLLQTVTDPNGLTMTYHYRAEGAQRYLERVAYDPFEILFDYEERPDHFVSRRSGFEIATTLRATQIRVMSKRSGTYELRRYELQYELAQERHLSMLSKIQLSAGSGADVVRMPPVTLEYAPLDFTQGNLETFSTEGNLAPPPLGEAGTAMVDLAGDGLPDIVTTDDFGMTYWRNLGENRFARPERVRSLPALSGLGDEHVQFSDMEGNGTADLLLGGAGAGYLPNAAGLDWEEFVPYETNLPFDLTDANLRLMDIDGDGRMDAIYSGEDSFLIFTNQGGKDGWAQDPLVIARRRNLDDWPDVFFSSESVRFADMTGDSLLDIVLLERGQIAYWPYLGHGQWGTRIIPDNQPRLPPDVEQSRLSLVDIDGDGAVDLVLMDEESITIWVNRSGRAFSDETKLDLGVSLPEGGSFLLDAKGEGRPGLILSYPGATSRVRNYRYIPIGHSASSFLLHRIDNGLGAITEIEYKSAETWRNKDRRHGNDWTTFLPFPVQTVASITVTDRWTGHSAKTRFEYKNGHYDGAERVFRGFAEVTEIEEGDSYSPGVVRRFRFSVGADLSKSEAERRSMSPSEIRLERARSGLELSADLYERSSADGTKILRESIRSEWSIEPVVTLGSNTILTRLNRLKETTSFGDNELPQRTIVRILGYDAEGDELERETIGGAVSETGNFIEQLYIRDTAVYARSNPDADGFSRKAVCELRQTEKDGTLLSLKRHYYDGASFVGLPNSSLEAGNLTRTEIFAFASDIDPNFPDADYVALGYKRCEIDGRDSWFVDAERFARNSVGAVTTQMGPIDERVELTFDPLGIHPVRTINAAGHETRIRINSRAEAIDQISHPSGHVETRIHDSLGRVIALQRLDDDGENRLTRVIRYEVGTGDQPSRIINIVPSDPLLQRPDALDALLITPLDEIRGAFVQAVYHDGTGNELQRRVTAEASDAGEFRVLVSGKHHLSQRKFVYREDAPYFASSFAYAPPTLEEQHQEFSFLRDFEGRVTRAERLGDQPRLTQYSPWSVTAWDERSIAAGQRSKRTETFDAWGRLVSVEEDAMEGKRQSSYELDTLGRIICVFDHRERPLIKIDRDGIGRKIGSWHVDGGERRSLLNAGGRVIESLLPDGRLRMTYDAINRVTGVYKVTADSHQRIRSFHYDQDPANPECPFMEGRIAMVEDEAGILAFRYNRIGQTTSKSRTLNDGRQLSVSTDYRLTGEIEAMTYPNGRNLNFVYNEAGLLDAIPGVIDKTRYRVDGRIEERQFSSGVTESYAYDSLDRLHLFSVKNGASDPLLSLDYSFGAGLEINKISCVQGLQRSEKHFEYDGFNQLTGMGVQSVDDSPDCAYRYDRNGNVLAIGHATEEKELAYNDVTRPHRLTHIRQTGVEEHLQYDTCGRITSLPDLDDMSYDIFGRLIQATNKSGTIVKHDYGHEYDRVRRVRTKDDVVTETLYFDDIFETSGDIDRCHIIVGGAILGSIISGVQVDEDIQLFHSDHLGSTQLITNSDGRSIASPTQSPYGTIPAHGRAPGLFIGRDYDPDLGLVYMQMRWYVPKLGRFVSPDTAVLDAPENFIYLSCGMNPYAYAVNNPVKYRDPNGRFPVLAAVIIGAVVGGVLGYQAAKEQGKNPWTGALIGAVIGGILGYAGGLPALKAAGKGALVSGGMNIGTAVLTGNEVENVWTSMAVGFAFGGFGEIIGTWTPTSGSGIWVDTSNIAKEIAVDAAVGGLRGLAMAAITDGDLSSGFFEGALSGAAMSSVKIALMGVRYDPMSGKTGQATGVEAQTRAEYQNQSVHDKSHLRAQILNEKFPQTQDVQFRRHGLITRVVAQIPNRGGSIVLGNNILMSKGEHYRVTTIAHELRHIHQQQLLKFGTVEFLVRYFFMQDHSQHYQPGNTTYEPNY